MQCYAMYRRADVSEVSDGSWHDGIGAILTAWPSTPNRCCDSGGRHLKDLESRHQGNHAMVAKFEVVMIMQSETMNGFSALHCNLPWLRW